MMKREFPEKKTILIVTGGPGTGKSGTARCFLSYMQNREIESISYDSLKEEFWDRFGFDNAAEKDRVNSFALEAFYLTVGHAMWQEKTILIEYPFYQRHKASLEELVARYGYHAVTIYLHTDMHTMYLRGTGRDKGGRRHPGHLLDRYHKEDYNSGDLQNIRNKALSEDELAESLKHKEYNVSIGEVVDVDVTDFSIIDYEGIYRKICAAQQKQA